MNELGIDLLCLRYCCNFKVLLLLVYLLLEWTVHRKFQSAKRNGTNAVIFEKLLHGRNLLLFVAVLFLSTVFIGVVKSMLRFCFGS